MKRTQKGKRRETKCVTGKRERVMWKYWPLSKMQLEEHWKQMRGESFSWENRQRKNTTGEGSNSRVPPHSRDDHQWSTEWITVARIPHTHSDFPQKYRREKKGRWRPLLLSVESASFLFFPLLRPALVFCFFSLCVCVCGYVLCFLPGEA